jgi:hypothetical protein
MRYLVIVAILTAIYFTSKRLDTRQEIDPNNIPVDVARKMLLKLLVKGKL